MSNAFKTPNSFVQKDDATVAAMSQLQFSRHRGNRLRTTAAKVLQFLSSALDLEGFALAEYFVERNRDATRKVQRADDG